MARFFCVSPVGYNTPRCGEIFLIETRPHEWHRVDKQTRRGFCVEIYIYLRSLVVYFLARVLSLHDSELLIFKSFTSFVKRNIKQGGRMLNINEEINVLNCT